MTRPLFERLRMRTVETEADIERSSQLLAGALASDEYARIYRLSRDALRDCPYMRKERSFLAELDGRVVARVQIIDLRLQIGEVFLPAVGFSGLVVEPEFQGLGIILHFEKRLMRQVIEEGALVMMGYTGLRRYYERMGGVTVIPDYELSFDLAARERHAPTLRQVTDDDLPALMTMYRDANLGRTGVLERTVDRWPWLYRRSDSYLIDAHGYAGLQVNEEGIVIDEIAGGDSFFDSLLQELAASSKDSMVKVTAEVPPDHPFARFAARLGSASTMEVRSSGGGMARILDLDGLLLKLQPQIGRRFREMRPGAPALRLTFTTPEGVEASCRLGDPAPSDPPIIVKLSLKAITRLLFGTLPPAQVLEEAAFAGPDDLATLLCDLFPQTFPHTWRADKF